VGAIPQSSNRKLNMSFADDAIERVLGHEGGYSNNPADSGGETNWGITVAVARAYGFTAAMSTMTREQAKPIYLAKFWHSQRLDQVAAIAFDVAFEIFDTGVNQGETVGAMYFQRALNVLNKGGTLYPDLSADGRLGAVSIAAFKEYVSRRGAAGVKVMMKALNCLQGAFYIELAEKRPKDETFIYGWLDNRVGI
jgi:lysozyme family protein